MLDLIAKLIDRLIQLSAYEGERSRRLLAEFYDPMFGDLMLIHTQYVAIFEKSYKHLEKLNYKTPAKQPFNILVSQFQKEGRTFEVNRRKTQALIRELGKKQNLSRLEKDFVRSVSDYFYIDFEVTRERISMSSHISTFSELLNEANDFVSKLDVDSRAELFRLYSRLYEINTKLLLLLRHRWSAVTAAYAALKIDTSFRA